MPRPEDTEKGPPEGVYQRVHRQWEAYSPPPAVRPMLNFILCTRDTAASAHVLAVPRILEIIYQFVYPYDGLHHFTLRDIRFRAVWTSLTFRLSADRVHLIHDHSEQGRWRPVEWDGKNCTFGTADPEVIVVAELSRHEKGPLRAAIDVAATGYTIKRVQPGGLAHEHGVRSGDVLVKCNNRMVEGETQSQIRMLLEKRPLRLVCRRPGQSSRDMLRVRMSFLTGRAEGGISLGLNEKYEYGESHCSQLSIEEGEPAPCEAEPTKAIPLPGAVLYKQLPAVLTEPYYYLSAEQAGVIRSKVKALNGWVEHLPCWGPWRQVARALGYSEQGLDKAAACFGDDFVWATEFENVHSTWKFDSEQPLVINGRKYCKGGPTGPTELFYHEQKPVPFDKELWNGTADGQGMRDRVMRAALTAKFEEPRLRELLASTYPHPLVSIKGDRYWGFCPRKGAGANQLAKILEELREEIS